MPNFVLKKFVDSERDNIKKLSNELIQYQHFCNFYDIIFPAVVIHEKENKDVVGITYVIEKSLDLSEYQLVNGYVEVDLRHLVKESHVDVVSGITILDSVKHVPISYTLYNVDLKTNKKREMTFVSEYAALLTHCELYKLRIPIIASQYKVRAQVICYSFGSEFRKKIINLFTPTT